MRWALWLWAVGCHVKLPSSANDANFIADNDRPVQLTLLMPACPVIGRDVDFVFRYSVAVDGARLTIERKEATASVVLQRKDLGGELEGTLTIPRQSLLAGVNHFTIWVTGRELISETQDYALDVRTPLSTGAIEDLDSDCYSPRLGDCNDMSANVSPSAIEVCDDRVDNDCDGLIDAQSPTCSGMCPDSDGDLHLAKYCGGDDCDDARAGSHPLATETCNGIDDNCDGQFDEDFDTDMDGFIHCPTPTTIVRTRDGSFCPAGYSTCDDCSDNSATVFPGDSLSSCL